MSLQQYIEQLQAVVTHLSTTSFVAETVLNIDLRAGDQAFVQGVVYFIDKSSLHFKEYTTYALRTDYRRETVTDKKLVLRWLRKS